MPGSHLEARKGSLLVACNAKGSGLNEIGISAAVATLCRFSFPWSTRTVIIYVKPRRPIFLLGLLRVFQIISHLQDAASGGKPKWVSN